MQRRTLAALLTAMAVSTACQQAPAPPAVDSQDKPAMDLTQLPTVQQTRVQMLELIDAVQREVTRLVPATRPWKWSYSFSTTACDGGIWMGFPKLGSDHGLSDAEWARAAPAVIDLAAKAGLTNAGGFQNTTGNHDMRIGSPDGRQLVFATRVATLITASVSCRRTGDEPLWVNGRIPMPPDPQP